MENCKKNGETCPEKREELKVDCLNKVAGGADESNGSGEPKSDTGEKEQGILLPEI